MPEKPKQEEINNAEAAGPESDATSSYATIDDIPGSDHPATDSKLKGASPSHPPQKSRPPKRAKGFDYELRTLIGEGGFGEVWLATNIHDKQFYAVKLFHRSRNVELEGVREYKKRAKDHPKLVPIEHVGELEDYYYYVMPLAEDATSTSPVLDPNQYEAMTLHRYLARLAPLPIDEVLAIAGDLIDGLDHLHSMGAAHCDVKPGNVMRMTGSWRLGDHGLMIRSENVSPSRGTMKFWPPEGPHDRGADLYALGKTMYLALTGENLNRFGEFMAGTLTIPGDDPRAAALRKIILDMCADKPENRLSSAKAIRDALNRLAKKPARRKATGGRWALIASAAIILALIGYWVSGGLVLSPESSTPAAVSSAAPEKVEVKDLRIRHHRGEEAELIGDLGTTSHFAIVQDDIRLQMQLSQPAYCYLIAFNPDGRDQLCYPDSDMVPPLKVEKFDFPTDQNLFYGLTDGAGIQAFVLLASNQPLPAYQQWRFRIGELPWQHFDSEGIWRYNNGQLDMQGSLRGTVRQRTSTPEPFVSTCEKLQLLSHVDAVYAVAFPVIDIVPSMDDADG